MFKFAGPLLRSTIFKCVPWIVRSFSSEMCTVRDSGRLSAGDEAQCFRRKSLPALVGPSSAACIAPRWQRPLILITNLLWYSVRALHKAGVMLVMQAGLVLVCRQVWQR